ncbi:hypothetical protein ACIP4U_29365 [Streptomyces caelestis]|uniref:hypothetical protein n=1 Tax=Streptomyces caelestis TaxID=36816 RepID=UPI0037F5A2BB
MVLPAHRADESPVNSRLRAAHGGIVSQTLPRAHREIPRRKPTQEHADLTQ